MKEGCVLSSECPEDKGFNKQKTYKDSYMELQCPDNVKLNTVDTDYDIYVDMLKTYKKDSAVKFNMDFF